MKNFLFLNLILSSVFLSYPVWAVETPGDFNSYESGNLNGQDGWTDKYNSFLVIDNIDKIPETNIALPDGATSSTQIEEKKAIKNQSGFAVAAYKELAKSFYTSGVIKFDFKIENNIFSDNQDLAGIYRGVTDDFIVALRFANNFDGRTDMLLLSTAGSSEVREIGQISQGEWHTFTLGWREIDFKIRFKVDNGEWSDWFESQTTWGDSLILQTVNNTDINNLSVSSSENPDVGNFGIRFTAPPAETYGDFYFADLQAERSDDFYPMVIDIIDDGTTYTTSTMDISEEFSEDKETSVVKKIVEFFLELIGISNTTTPINEGVVYDPEPVIDIPVGVVSGEQQVLSEVVVDDDEVEVLIPPDISVLPESTSQDELSPEVELEINFSEEQDQEVIVDVPSEVISEGVVSSPEVAEESGNQNVVSTPVEGASSNAEPVNNAGEGGAEAPATIIAI